jgi:hypothetical protein
LGLGTAPNYSSINIDTEISGCIIVAEKSIRGIMYCDVSGFYFSGMKLVSYIAKPDSPASVEDMRTSGKTFAISLFK